MMGNREIKFDELKNVEELKSSAESENLVASKNGSEGLSGRVSYLCAVANAAIQDEIPALKEEEWLALADIFEGFAAAIETDPEVVADSFTSRIAHLGPFINKKWGVNSLTLSKRYNNMRLIEKLAVLEVLRKFWTLDMPMKKFESSRDAIEYRGAKFSE
jgi:hypothetical protein